MIQKFLLIDRSFLMVYWAECKWIHMIHTPRFPMKISTVTCLAFALVGLVASAVHSEEPEQLNRPEAISVPVAPAEIDQEKSAAPQTDNTTIHLDANNRLVGLSN
jgi:hypothetical protein